MSKRQIVLLLIAFIAIVNQTGCAPLAAGVAGGVVGHAVAKHQDDDDDDDD